MSDHNVASETTRDSRGAFVVGVRGRGWCDPSALYTAMAAVGLQAYAAGRVSPREALLEAMVDSYTGPYMVTNLPKGKGLVILKLVPSHDGNLKEGMPVFAASVTKDGTMDVIHDPDDENPWEPLVRPLYERYLTQVSPGRLVAMVRKYAEKGLSGAAIDSITWLPERSVEPWRKFVATVTSVASLRISTVKCSVDEETAKAVIDHVTAARLKEADAIATRVLALDPFRELAGAEIRALARRARQLEAQVARDEADIGVSLTSVRELLAKAQNTKAIASVQEAVAG